MASTKTKAVSTQKMNDITVVRQQIRKKLIQIGLQMQADSKKASVSKTSKQKSKQRSQDGKNLPALKSQRSKKLVVSQFYNVFTQPHQILQSDRLNLSKMSKGRSKNYNNSIESMRDVSLDSTNKQPPTQKMINSPQQNGEEIPWLKKLSTSPHSTITQPQPLHCIRLFETKPTKDPKRNKALYIISTISKRSKTQQRKPDKGRIRDLFYELKCRDITPWEYSNYKDTRVGFQ